jgi:hypothetical protein
VAPLGALRLGRLALTARTIDGEPVVEVTAEGVRAWLGDEAIAGPIQLSRATSSAPRGRRVSTGRRVCRGRGDGRVERLGKLVSVHGRQSLIYVRLYADTVEELDAWVAELQESTPGGSGISRSDVIRDIVVRAMDRRKTKKKAPRR